MATISLALFESATSDSSVGDAAFTNPSRAKTQLAVSTTDTWAESSLNPGQTTQRLTLINPTYDIDPEDTIVGVLGEVHGYTKTNQDTILESEYLLIHAGSAVGTDQATGRLMGRPTSDTASNVFLYGGPSSLMGATLDASIVNSATFGHGFRAELPSDEAADISRVGVCPMAVYWQATPRCRLTRITPLAVEVGNQIGVHARNSIVGSASPEHVTIRYELTSYPVGYTPRTYTNPIPGQPGGATLSEATDGRGWCYIIRPTVAGSYSIRATMLLNDNGTHKRVLSNVVTFTVGASTRSLRYLDPVGGNDNNDGLAMISAWQTLAKAHAVLDGKKDWELVIKDATTINLSSVGPNFNNIKNSMIRRSADGASKPIIQCNGSFQAWEFGSATDLTIVGIKVKGNFGTPTAETNFLHSPDAMNRISIIDCEAEDIQSFFEGNDISCFLVQNSLVTEVTRYDAGGLFVNDVSKPSGMCCVWGGDYTTSAAETGEGGFRLANALTTRSYGQCASFNFVAMDANGTDHSSYRRGWNFTFLNRCSITDSTIGASHPPAGSASRGPAEWVSTIHGCYIDTDNWNGMSRQAHHVCWSHCIIKAETGATGRAGFIYQYSMVNCLFITPTGSTAIGVINNSTTDDVYFYGFRMVGNVHVYESALSGITAIPMFNNRSVKTLFDTDDAFRYNIEAKAATYKDQNIVVVPNNETWATGNVIVAVEGSDIDTDNGWTASSLNILPAISSLVCEDARGIVHDPEDENWNCGPISLTTLDATALANYENATPVDPTYTNAWVHTDTYDPGSDAESLVSGGDEGTQTVPAGSGTGDWAECSGDGLNPFLDPSTWRCTGNTSASLSRTLAGIFVVGQTIPSDSTIDSFVVKIDPSGANNDLSATFYFVASSNCAAFNTTTRDPESIYNGGAGIVGSGVSFTIDDFPDGLGGTGRGNLDVTSYAQTFFDTYGMVAGQRIGYLLRGHQNLGSSKIFAAVIPTNGTTPPIADVTWTEPIPLSPPGTFNLLTPTNTATGTSVLPTFTWEIASGASSYNLVVTRVSGSVVVIDEDLSTTTFTAATSLTASTAYSWTVTATNTDGSTPADSTFTFTTGVAGSVPESFNLISPSDNEMDVAIAPTFEWEECDNAASYTLTISSGGDEVFSVEDLTDTTYSPGGIFDYETTYTWTVTAINEFGETVSTPSDSDFTIVAEAESSSLEVRSTSAISSGNTYSLGTHKVKVPTTYQFSIKNIGEENITVSSVTVSGSGYKILSSNNPKNIVIPPESTAEIDLKVKFATTGTKTGTLTINSNDVLTPYIINFTARASSVVSDTANNEIVAGGSIIRADLLEKGVRRFNMVLSDDFYPRHLQGIKFGGEKMSLFNLGSNRYALGVYVINNSSNIFDPQNFNANPHKMVSLLGYRFQTYQDNLSRDVIAVTERDNSTIADTIGLYGYEMGINSQGDLICKAVSGQATEVKSVLFGGAKVKIAKVDDFWYLVVLPV